VHRMMVAMDHVVVEGVLEVTGFLFAIEAPHIGVVVAEQKVRLAVQVTVVSVQLGMLDNWPIR
jgi:hypothetical protein